MGCGMAAVLSVLLLSVTSFPPVLPSLLFSGYGNSVAGGDRRGSDDSFVDMAKEEGGDSSTRAADPPRWSAIAFNVVLQFCDMMESPSRPGLVCGGCFSTVHGLFERGGGKQRTQRPSGARMASKWVGKHDQELSGTASCSGVSSIMWSMSTVTGPEDAPIGTGQANDVI